MPSRVPRRSAPRRGRSSAPPPTAAWRPSGFHEAGQGWRDGDRRGRALPQSVHQAHPDQGDHGASDEQPERPGTTVGAERSPPVGRTTVGRRVPGNSARNRRSRSGTSGSVCPANHVLSSRSVRCSVMAAPRRVGSAAVDRCPLGAIAAHSEASTGPFRPGPRDDRRSPRSTDRAIEAPPRSVAPASGRVAPDDRIPCQGGGARRPRPRRRPPGARRSGSDDGGAIARSRH